MAKRSLIFEPSPNYHHYYDILDDSFKGKRERSSEEDETTSDQRLAAKMKQVKKRVKRIDQKGNNNPDQVRRSREIQDLLKRNPNYQRPKRGDEATECLAASTPCVMKAKKSYRRPHRVRHHSANNDSSSTYLGVEQPKPEGEEQEEEEDEGIVVGVPAGSESAPGSPLASHFRRGGSCRWSLLGGGRRRKKQSSGAKGAANRERSKEERRGAQRVKKEDQERGEGRSGDGHRRSNAKQEGEKGSGKVNGENHELLLSPYPTSVVFVRVFNRRFLHLMTVEPDPLGLRVCTF